MGPLPLCITVIYPQRNLDKIENDKNEFEFCFSFISFTLGKIRKDDKTEVDFRFSVKWDGRDSSALHLLGDEVTFVSWAARVRRWYKYVINLNRVLD